MDDKTFESLLDLFASEGWKFFITSNDELKDALINAAPEGAITNDQWQYARGEIKQLRSVSSFEAYIRAGFAEQERQAAEALAEGDTDATII